MSHKEGMVYSWKKQAQLCAVEKERDYYKTQALKYNADAVHATLVLNQTFEQISKDEHVSINSKVKQAGGLEHHIVESNEAFLNGTNKVLHTTHTANQKTRKMAL